MEKSKAQMVIDYINDEIEAGRLLKGQRLPSCRRLSEILSLNKITINKSYAQLEQQHRVYSIPRGGFYLVDDGIDDPEPEEMVDFCAVKPDDKLIPYREFTHVINKAVELYRNELFGYESRVGLASLRHTLKDRFEGEGVYTEADDMIVTNGAQQGINLALQLLFRHGRTSCIQTEHRDAVNVGSRTKLLVEIPTYSLVLQLAEQMELELVTIERSEEGYAFKELEQKLKSGDIRAFYIVPRHHNPTGYTLAEKDKRRVAELCQRYGVYIIEDDYLSELGARKGAMPIHYYDTGSMTLHIRSFSKTFMPGIRLGVLVLPPKMVQAAAEMKRLADLNTSKLPQAALELFIQSGMYDKHIIKIRKAYEAKLRKATEILAAYRDNGLTVHIPEYGIYLWITLPDGVDAQRIETRLQKQGIMVKASNEFYPVMEQRKEATNNLSNNNTQIRLCIAGVPVERLGALAQVASVILAARAEV